MATLQEIRARMAEQRGALEDVSAQGFSSLGFASADRRYHQLFAQYVPALRAAKAEADAWWQGLIDTETARIGDAAEALTNVLMKRSAGSVVHGAVIHAFRTAWLGCEALNQSLGSTTRVEPFELTVEWLLAEGQPDLAEYLGRFPFLPVALDGQGQWV